MVLPTFFAKCIMAGLVLRYLIFMEQLLLVKRQLLSSSGEEQVSLDASS